MDYGLKIKSQGEFDLISLGALVHRLDPVSYTHLDVYKRQILGSGSYDQQTSKTS